MELIADADKLSVLIRYVACKQMTLDEFRRMASRFESKRRLSAKRNRYNYRANVLAAYRDQFPSGGTLELRADCSLLHWVAGLHADYQPPEIVSAVDMALDAEEIIEAVSAEFKQRIAALSEIWVKNARGRNA